MKIDIVLEQGKGPREEKEKLYSCLAYHMFSMVMTPSFQTDSWFSQPHYFHPSLNVC